MKENVVVNLSPDALVATAWAVWLVSWVIASAWSSPAARRPARQREIAFRLLTTVGAVLMFGGGLRPAMDFLLWTLAPTASWTLAAVTIGGFLFTWWARLTLGRLWSSGVTRKADHVIITTGPYRFVRHPIYTGLILSACATALMRGTVRACAGAALIVFGLWIKARLEEEFLRDELGEAAYGNYADRVPMLVPFARR
jgi:protein-S-isoprenylcysteine O-methyltransferase Ste14